MRELLEKIFAEIKKNPGGVKAYEDLYYICVETMKTDEALGVQYLKLLSDCIEAQIPAAGSDKDLRFLFGLHKRVLLAAAPLDFESYLLYVEWNREPEKKFYVPRREVLRPIVQAMQDMIDDKIDLLTISMPPGTGKSTLGIFFLSWVMGKFPDGQNLASAHSGMLTRSFYDGVYQIITDSEYLWSDVFPGVQLAATNSKEETIDLNKKHRFSTLTCRAINASLTGATRCDKILYADDLCSGIEEAMSKERLDKLWAAYTNDLKSRKKMGAKEIHIATRWSVHDVIGRLEQQYGDDSRAKFIVLPALDSEGESNFNYGYDVGFDKKYFEDMRLNLDEASFKALFMNKNKTLSYKPQKNEMIITVHRWFANKSCPGDWLYNRLGELATTVTQRLGGTGATTNTPSNPKPSTGAINALYRVRKSWADSKSQIGAFKSLDNAKATANKNPGYSVFDNSGKVVYAPGGTSTSFKPYLVRVTTDVLNIRKGAGTNYGTNGAIRDKGTYTIVEEATGAGATLWGKLKSGAGWISLDFTTKV